MRIGIPKETLAGERRVAATPESTKKLRDLGFEVAIERGAGEASGYLDDAYVAAGAELVTGEGEDAAFAADVVLKVRPPTPIEIARLHERSIVVSLMQPERDPELEGHLVARKVTAIALERIPRVTRAQKMDVLSSMANLAGYRAVIEAAAHLPGFFGPQVTAAGSSPPAKVLIIGAGVAGLASIAAARALGADVRAFDTRAAAREQVESLGAKFLEVEMTESGEGGGGYAKLMSPEFIAAEMALFRAQAAEVDVIITTALVPGAKAPTLVPRDVVEALRRGSVVVDLAAEQGGNCELTVPGEVVDHRGVKILGFTDLTSRMANVASRLFATNLVHLITDMTGKAGAAAFKVDLDDEVVRPAVLVFEGEKLPPPPRKEPTPPKKPPVKSIKPPPPEAKATQQKIMSPARRAWGTTGVGLVVIAGVFVMGRFAPQEFTQHFTVFVLACFVGWQVIWSVSPSLHTPLMSVTNAISGIIVVGGMLQIGADAGVASLLGAFAVLLATINISGGFLVTQRMLRMFRRDPDAAPKSSGHVSHAKGHAKGGAR